MLLTIVFGIINAILSFLGNQYLRFSAFDITPAAVMIVAWNSGNIWITAIVLVLSYAVVNPKEFRFIWLTLPMAFVIGYLALLTKNAFLLLAFYHLVGASGAFFFGYFNGKYAGFIMLNFILNFAITRIYTFF